MKDFYKKGISTMEILFVLAVLVLLFSVVLPQFSRIKEVQVLKNVTGDVLSSLNKAQSQTLASVNSSSYGVHFQSDKIVIFTGTSYWLGSATNLVIDVNSPVSISNVTFGGDSASSGDVYFNRLLGTPNTSGTITISSANYSKVVTVSATGVSSSN